MKRVLIAGAGLLMLAAAQPVIAADMPTRIAKSPVMAPGFANHWTGFTIGAHAGWGWSKGDRSVTFLPNHEGFGAAPFGVSNDRDGFVAGGRMDYNWTG